MSVTHLPAGGLRTHYHFPEQPLELGHTGGGWILSCSSLVRKGHYPQMSHSGNGKEGLADMLAAPSSSKKRKHPAWVHVNSREYFDKTVLGTAR